MEYVISHFGLIVVVAIIMALVCFATVLMAAKNDAERDISDERCEFECGSCEYTQQCRKPGNKV